MKKQDLKNNLFLISDGLEKNKHIKLTEEEQKLKEKLLEIEEKIDSIENALNSIAQEKDKTLFGDKMFSAVVGKIAVTAATNIIAEYFNVSKEDLNNLI